MYTTRPLLIGTLLFFWSINWAMAQENQLSFDYDIAGNQIKRYFTVEPNTTRDLSNKELLTSQPEDGHLADEDLENKFKVYPNSTTGLVAVEWEVETNVSIDRVDLTPSGGFDHVELDYQSIDNNTIQLDLTSERSGIYFIRLFLSDGRMVTKKVIKE